MERITCLDLTKPQKVEWFWFCIPGLPVKVNVDNVTQPFPFIRFKDLAPAIKRLRLEVEEAQRQLSTGEMAFWDRYDAMEERAQRNEKYGRLSLRACQWLQFHELKNRKMIEWAPGAELQLLKPRKRGVSVSLVIQRINQLLGEPHDDEIYQTKPCLHSSVTSLSHSNRRIYDA